MHDPPPIAGPSVGRDSDLLRRLGIRLGPVFSGEFRKDLSDVVMSGVCNFMSLDIIGRPVLAPPP